MGDLAQNEQPGPGDINLDHFFDTIPEDLTFDPVDLDLFQDQPVVVDPSPELSTASPDSVRWMNEIEKFLLEEEGGVAEEDSSIPLSEDFFSDVFAVGFGDGVAKSTVSNGGVSSPEVNAMEESREKEKSGISEEKDEEDEDPISRKRKRQMRNRNSAMKSRERKKMYVTDLEMKSRYLESECRRLQHALQCCMAENLALHHQLQKKRAFGVPSAKQESAVLFLESLLLGSLFWLLSIVCLFLVPNLLAQNPELVVLRGNARRWEESQTPETDGERRLGNKRLGLGLGWELVLMSRRYKAMRTKMKICLFSL